MLSTSLNNDTSNLLLLNNKVLNQQHEPLKKNKLYSTGLITPIFKQLSDTTSRLSHSTPVTSLTNISEIKKMGGNLSTNSVDNDQYCINNNKKEIVINDQLCNLSHNHPIYKFF